MQLNMLIVSVLFHAIPLTMINFGNRYSLLAGLIRNLHDAVISEKASTDDSARFFRQIANLRQRLRLIAIIQTCSSLAFIFNLSAIISLFLHRKPWQLAIFLINHFDGYGNDSIHQRNSDCQFSP